VRRLRVYIFPPPLTLRWHQILCRSPAIMLTVANAGDAGKLFSCPSSDLSGIPSDFKTVARIAYLSSDLVLSVQPALGVDSDFSRQLRGLASRKNPGCLTKAPEVCRLHYRASKTTDRSRRFNPEGTMRILFCPLSSRFDLGSSSRLPHPRPYCSRLHHISTS